jgi:PIF1-like helicase/Helicase
LGQHEDHKVALCVASSGIASLLLDGGRTAHSRFKIPIPVFENSGCNISKNSTLSQVLQQTGIIIWDEVPMQYRFAVEALDRTLQDVLENKKPFGGITVLFGGDFHQTLPVVPRSSRHQILGASLRNSKLWKHVKMFFLKKNMHLNQTPESETFAKYLLEVGAGKNSNPNGTITLYPEMRCGDTVNSLIDVIYPGIAEGAKQDAYFKDRTLLSCKNDDVDDLNADILAKFPGGEKVHMSADSVVTDKAVPIDYQPYPVEYLNSLICSGLPLARLALKPGCPLMLLQNLDPSNGLCNGTRMILLRIKSHVLECRILGGDGKTVFIPRISIEPSDGDLHIPLSCRQFPVCLAFAMTINKSQGQSVQNVGLDLRTSVFSHGQLYVALSQCTSASRIKVLFPEKEKGTKTPNIVWDQILAGII